ncbi:MAG: DMT family transporter [Endozoicomonas sp.]
MEAFKAGQWNHKQQLAIAGLVLATVCWGGNSVAGRLSVGEIPPVALSFWRWTLAFVILLLFCGRKVVAERQVIWRYKGKLVLLAITSITSFNTLLYIAAQTTQAVNITLVQISLPVVAIVLSIPLLKVFPSKRELLGVLIALPGLLVIFSHGNLSALAELRFGRGDMIMMLATCCWGLYTVLLKRFSIPLNGLVLLTVLVGMGLCFLSPFYLWEYSLKGGFELDANTALLLTYVVLFASLTAYLSWNHGVAVLGANTASMFNFLIPVFSASFAIPILGESLHGYHLVGASFIFSGIWLATRNRVYR